MTLLVNQKTVTNSSVVTKFIANANGVSINPKFHVDAKSNIHVILILIAAMNFFKCFFTNSTYTWLSSFLFLFFSNISSQIIQIIISDFFAKDSLIFDQNSSSCSALFSLQVQRKQLDLRSVLLHNSNYFYPKLVFTKDGGKYQMCRGT